MSAHEVSEGRLLVSQDGQGQPLSVAASCVISGPASWTDGAYNVMDQIVQAGLLVPPHLHDVEDQASFVVSGTLGFWVDGEVAEVSAGGYILRPKGKAHALWNATDKPARMLEITSPAKEFERYMQTLSDMVDSGEGTPASVAELAGQYGIRFVDGAEELSARFGVSPAGGFWK